MGTKRIKTGLFGKPTYVFTDDNSEIDGLEALGTQIAPGVTAYLEPGQKDGLFAALGRLLEGRGVSRARALSRREAGPGTWNVEIPHDHQGPVPMSDGTTGYD